MASEPTTDPTDERPGGEDQSGQQSESEQPRAATRTPRKRAASTRSIGHDRSRSAVSTSSRRSPMPGYLRSFALRP